MATVAGMALGCTGAQPSLWQARRYRQARAKEAIAGRLQSALDRVRQLEGELTVERLLWVGIDGDGELQRRLQAVRPALGALVEGRSPAPEQRLRRNVALHARASGIDVAVAPAALLRQAQRGPRLRPEDNTDEVAESDLNKKGMVSVENIMLPLVGAAMEGSPEDYPGNGVTEHCPERPSEEPGEAKQRVQGVALPEAKDGLRAVARVVTTKSLAFVRDPNGGDHVMVGRLDRRGHCAQQGARIAMPVGRAGGLTGVRAGAMAKKMAYTDAQTAEVVARVLSIYGVVASSGCDIVKMTLVEYEDGQVLVEDSLEFGGAEDVSQALMEGHAADRQAITLPSHIAASKKKHERAMVRMALTEYSDDLVLTGEVEFGCADNVSRALSGSVSAGSEAYGGPADRGHRLWGLTREEPSRRGRKPNGPLRVRSFGLKEEAGAREEAQVRRGRGRRSGRRARRPHLSSGRGRGHRLRRIADAEEQTQAQHGLGGAARRP